MGSPRVGDRKATGGVCAKPQAIRRTDPLEIKVGIELPNEAADPNPASSRTKGISNICKDLTVVAHGTQIMHILHVVLTGKWNQTPGSASRLSSLLPVALSLRQKLRITFWTTTPILALCHGPLVYTYHKAALYSSLQINFRGKPALTSSKLVRPLYERTKLELSLSTPSISETFGTSCVQL